MVLNDDFKTRHQQLLWHSLGGSKIWASADARGTCWAQLGILASRANQGFSTGTVSPEVAWGNFNPSISHYLCLHRDAKKQLLGQMVAPTYLPSPKHQSCLFSSVLLLLPTSPRFLGASPSRRRSLMLFWLDFTQTEMVKKNVFQIYPTIRISGIFISKCSFQGNSRRVRHGCGNRHPKAPGENTKQPGI